MNERSKRRENVESVEMCLEERYPGRTKCVVIKLSVFYFRSDSSIKTIGRNAEQIVT